MVRSRKKRTRRRRRRRDRSKSDRGGIRKVEVGGHDLLAPSKWIYHHNVLMPDYWAGKLKGKKGPSFGDALKGELSWKGVHHQGGRRSRRHRGGAGYRRCGNYLADCEQSLVINSQDELGPTGGGPPTVTGGQRKRRGGRRKRRGGRRTRRKRRRTRRSRRRRGGRPSPWSLIPQSFRATL